MSIELFAAARIIILMAAVTISTAKITHARYIAYPSEFNHPSNASLNFNPKPIVWEEPTFQEKDIFILVNYHRKLNDLKPMKWERNLAKMARYYSRKMAEEDFFEHEDFEGKTVVDRAKDFRVKNWTKIGENLFYCEGFISPTKVAVQGWLDSPGHRMNMLDSDWTHSAIGVYEKRGMITYITQVFLMK